MIHPRDLWRKLRYARNKRRLRSLSVVILVLGWLGLFAQAFLRRQTVAVPSGDVLMTISYPPVASTREDSLIYVTVLNTSSVPITPTVGLVYSSTHASAPYMWLPLAAKIQHVETEHVTVRSGGSSFVRFPRLAPGERCTEEIILRIGFQGLVKGLVADFELFPGPGKAPVKALVPITVWHLGLPLGLGAVSQSISWVWLIVAVFTALGAFKTVLDVRKLYRGERQR